MRAALREWISRLGGVFGRSRSDRDLELELQLHLDLAEQDLRRQGMSPEAAAREARLRVGPSTQTMETLRERRGIPALSTFCLDAKLGLRMLRKHWGLTLIGGLTLSAAMTIGTSVFNLVGALGGRTLPLEEGNRVVVIQPFDPETRQRRNSSREDFERWRTEVRSVEHVGAFRTVQRSLIPIGGPPDSVAIAEMSAAGFQVARIAPMFGRFLLTEDESTAAPPVVVIGYNVWQAKFAGNPEVLGQRVRLEGVSHTIVGVMPRGFAFPVNHQYWTSLRRNAVDRVAVFARLAPGSSVESAHAEVQSMGLRDATTTTGAGRPLQARLVPYVSGIGASGAPGGAIAAILPFVLPLLLIPPCANLAILIYARTVGRQAEFAARAALGASRGRIVAQILIEVLLLAVGAAGVALMLASQVGVWLKFLVAMGGQPFWMDFGLSYQTILFAGGLAVLAAAIAGGIPALRATGRWKRSGIHAFRGGSNPQLGKVWTVVVVAQVALSVAVVPTVAEVAWDAMRPAILGPGFDAGAFLTARLAMERPAAGVHFQTVRAEVVRQLTSEPGVSAVTMSEFVPFEESDVTIEIDDAGGGWRDRKSVALNQVDGAFFDAFRVAARLGRLLEAGDGDPAAGAVVVNRSFSRQVLGGGNPVGRRVRAIGQDSGPVYEIVGVVDDLFTESRIPTMYRRLSTQSDLLPKKGAVHQVRLTVRGGAPHLAGRLREITAAVDPALRVDDIQTLGEIYRRLCIGGLAGGGVVAGVTLCGVLFSVAGVYTSMVFAVVQRRREIGIRSALGASPGRLVAGVFRRVLFPVGVGVGLGAVAAMVLDSYLSPLLFDSGRPLPWILPAAEAFISLIAALALWGPVRRALRTDPMEAIRES
jgi:predicted permease